MKFVVKRIYRRYFTMKFVVKECIGVT